MSVAIGLLSFKQAAPQIEALIQAQAAAHNIGKIFEEVR